MYVDYCLVVSENPKRFFRDQIGKYLIVKEKSIGEPDHYLGRKIRKVGLANGARCWAFSSSQYVQEACRNVIKHLEQRNAEFNDAEKYFMPKKAGGPM